MHRIHCSTSPTHDSSYGPCMARMRRRRGSRSPHTWRAGKPSTSAISDDWAAMNARARSFNSRARRSARRPWHIDWRLVVCNHHAQGHPVRALFTSCRRCPASCHAPARVTPAWGRLDAAGPPGCSAPARAVRSSPTRRSSSASTSWHPGGGMIISSMKHSSYGAIGPVIPMSGQSAGRSAWWRGPLSCTRRSAVPVPPGPR